MKKLLLLLMLWPAILCGQNLLQAEYFFDEDPGYGNGIKLSFTEDVSVSLSANLNLGAIEPGFHTLYYRFKDDLNGWGHTFTYNVFVSENEQNITELEYFFDEDPGYGNGIKIYNGSVATLDLSANLVLEMLEPGYHVFFYRAKDEGSWGVTHRQPFYKTLRPKLNAVLYSFDDEEAIYIMTLENNVWILEEDFELDISPLNEGTHTLHLWVRNTDNTMSEVWSEEFIKGDLGVRGPSNHYKVDVFPVPVASTLNLETDADIQGIKLLSLNGKVLLSTANNVNSIDVTQIPDGVYLLYLKLRAGIEVYTVVVEH